MKQEIEVNVTLTIEGDAARDRCEISQFIGMLIPKEFESEGFSLMYHKIHRILEEGDIYFSSRPCGSAVWQFVEAYYPAYHSSGEIAENDDLSKMLSGELTGDAAVLFWGTYGGDLGKVLAAYNRSCREVNERAILGYVEDEAETISIRWSVKDVEERAKENGYRLKAGEALKMLELLKERHDCNIGITWDTIDDYLSYIVPDSLEDDGLQWRTLRFAGIEFLCRVIPDIANGGKELLVAPTELEGQMKRGDTDGTAQSLDDGIAYYATEAEMKLGDDELYQLIYA